MSPWSDGAVSFPLAPLRTLRARLWIADRVSNEEVPGHDAGEVTLACVREGKPAGGASLVYPVIEAALSFRGGEISESKCVIDDGHLKKSKS